MDRLSTLEDESSAVKLSLIQLLQDKSAVNQHLALQNSHLQKQVQVYVTVSCTCYSIFYYLSPV